MKYHLRPATTHDADGIVHLNALCYPEPGEAAAVWRRRHVDSHLSVFPEGQFVVTYDGVVVGAATSLVVSLGRDPYRDHTWVGITDNGMLFNHDPGGDTLYAVDITVHPDHRRRGVAGLMHEARRALARRLNLRRVVAGGRLAGYRDAAGEPSAEEYAKQVEAGERTDPALTHHLSAGYSMVKLLPSYLEDPRSADFGVFLEWVDPDHRPASDRPRRVRVSCVQYRMRKIEDFEAFAQQVTYFVDVAAGYRSQFVLFPELLTAQLMSFIDVKTPVEAIRRLTDYTEQLDELFVDLARRFQICIVGGTHPTRVGEQIHNICGLYLPDGTVHRQAKLHVTPNEKKWWGIDGGDDLRVFDTPAGRVGILICYDSEFPEAARYLVDQGAQIIFVPFCTDDRQAYLRVRYCCQARAVENQVYVAAAGTVGNLPDTENMDIQYAQSAVFSPSDFAFARDGIQVEASVNTETIITTDLDLDVLERAIHEGSVRQRRDRRPDLFRYVHYLE